MSKKYLIKFLVLPLVVSLFFSSLPLRVSAQSSGFSISPPSFELNANPGDIVKNSIKVINSSERSLSFKVRAENFIAYGEGGQVALTEEESTYSITKWLEFGKSEFSIPAKGTEVFDFILNIPKDAEPGSHYGAIVFSTGGGELEGSGASVLQEIGSIILIRIPGDVIEKGNLVSFTPSQQTYAEPNIQLSALLENTGSVHFKPSGYIYVRDLFGNKVQTIEVKGRNILPGSKRLFDESFSFEQVGFFKAELELFYKGGQEVIRGETSFVSLNKDKSLPVTVAGVGVIAFYLLFRKRINKALAVIVKG